MVKQCKECSCVVEDERALSTYEEFGYVLCEKCTNDYLNGNNNVQESEALEEATKPEPEPQTPAYCNMENKVNKPFEKSTDVVTTPHPQTRAIVNHGYTREQIDTIKNTVAKGATDSELQMFIHICQTYGLDPFLKEIYYSSEMHTIMSSRDGYLKVAQRDPDYMGMKSAVVCSNDVFEMDAVSDTITHTFKATERGDIVGAWAKVMHRNRDPVIQYVPFSEYNQKKSTWNKYPSAMILKCAEALALKRQFGISGLVTQEEMGVELGVQ